MWMRWSLSIAAEIAAAFLAERQDLREQIEAAAARGDGLHPGAPFKLGPLREDG